MGNDNDHYKTLNILKNASNKEIKIAYRRLARKYHPDKNSNVSEDIMKNINIAFEVLSDPEKRKQYDKTNIENENTEIKRDNRENSDNDKSNYQKKNGKINSSATNYDNTLNDNDTIDYSTEYNFNFRFKENETIYDLDIPKSQYKIIVEPSLCLAFGSCETLAPKVFVVEKNKRINPKAIVKSETGADFETILDAAKTCPTKAIIIIDRYSGERIYP